MNHQHSFETPFLADSKIWNFKLRLAEIFVFFPYKRSRFFLTNLNFQYVSRAKKIDDEERNFKEKTSASMAEFQRRRKEREELKKRKEEERIGLKLFLKDKLKLFFFGRSREIFFFRSGFIFLNLFLERECSRKSVKNTLLRKLKFSRRFTSLPKSLKTASPGRSKKVSF